MLAALTLAGPLLPGSLAGQVTLGCYDVELGAWTVHDPGRVPPEGIPAPDVLDGVAEHTPPPRLRLEADPAPGARGRRVSVPANSLQVPHRLRSWRVAGDTLHVRFSTGLVGVHLALEPTGDGGWRGPATTFTDVIGEVRYGRPATLTPVDCAAPPEYPASLDPPLPRTVPLVDGRVLELGAPPPADLELLPRPSGAWTAMAAASGRWAGNDTVVLRLDRKGVVHHIELRYPDRRDIASLADSVAPGHPYVHAGDGTRFWWNRTTRVFFRFGHGPKIVFSDPRHF